MKLKCGQPKNGKDKFVLYLTNRIFEDSNDKDLSLKQNEI